MKSQRSSWSTQVESGRKPEMATRSRSLSKAAPRASTKKRSGQAEATEHDDALDDIDIVRLAHLPLQHLDHACEHELICHHPRVCLELPVTDDVRNLHALDRLEHPSHSEALELLVVGHVILREAHLSSRRVLIASQLLWQLPRGHLPLAAPVEAQPVAPAEGRKSEGSAGGSGEGGRGETGD
eukprot:756749-Hanusia_phi.AAC.6